MPIIGEIKTNPNNPAQKARWDGASWVDASAPQGPRAAPAWGAGAVELPDGQVVRYGPKGGMTVLKKPGGGAEGLSLTEDQGKMTGAVTEMAVAEDTYRRARAQGYNPTSFRNSTASFFEGLPLGGLDGVGSFIRDPNADLGRQAELQFSDAQLKAKSGAAAPEAEVKRNVQIYFTRPNQNPESQDPVAERARAAAAAAARVRAGPGGAVAPAFPYAAKPGQSRVAPDLDAMTPEQRAAASRFKGTSAYAGTAENPVVLTDREQLQRLRKGMFYIGPDGAIRRNDNADRGNPIIGEPPRKPAPAPAGGADPLGIRGR